MFHWAKCHVLATASELSAPLISLHGRKTNPFARKQAQMAAVIFDQGPWLSWGILGWNPRSD